MNKDITWFVYKLSKNDKWLGFHVDKKLCRHDVYNDFGIGFHQCSRNPKVTIEGYGFCAQHAKMVKEQLK